jgi:hypothetical protein
MLITVAHKPERLAMTSRSCAASAGTFTDPRLCAAIVDRLTFNRTVIETDADSFRLASAQLRAEEPAKAG